MSKQKLFTLTEEQAMEIKRIFELSLTLGANPLGAYMAAINHYITTWPDEDGETARLKVVDSITKWRIRDHVEAMRA